MKNWFVLSTLFIAVGVLTAQGPGRGGGGGMHGGIGMHGNTGMHGGAGFAGGPCRLQLTEEQRAEMTALRDSLLTAGATREEIRAASRALLAEWGLQPPDGSSGRGQRPNSPARRPRIEQAFNQPNPFNPSTKIGYNLTAASAVAIAIYDLQGRLIRSYVQGFQPAGIHSVTWDGTLSSGQPAPTGIYFCRLTADNEVTTHRMLLMK